MLALVFGGCAAQRPDSPTTPAASRTAPETEAPGASAETLPPAGSTRQSTPSEEAALRRKTIAVFPFESSGPSGDERIAFLGDWLADSVGEELLNSGELRVVERRELLGILEEQKISQSGLTDPATQLRLGRMSGAQTMVFGGYWSMRGNVHIDARIVDAETGVVVRALSVHGPLSETRQTANRLASELAGGLGLEVGRKVGNTSAGRSSTVLATEAYYQARDFEEQGRVDEAIDRYQEVLRLEPGDTEAKERLKALLL